MQTSLLSRTKKFAIEILSMVVASLKKVKNNNSN